MNTPQSQKKIGIDARCLEGARTGTGRYLSNLLRYFGSATDLEFYLYFKHEIPTDAYFQEFSYKLKLLTPMLGRESNTLFTHLLLPRAMREDGIGLLFAPSYVASWNSPVPMVLTLHDISYEAHPEWTPLMDRVFLRMVSKHAAKKAARIITVSEFSKREIARLYTIPADRIAVTPLAPDPDLGTMLGEAEENRVLEKLGVGENFLLSVGTLINRRYPLETLYAFAAVAKKMPALQLVFVGGDRTHPPLGIAKHIDRVNAELGRHAVIVLPFVSDQELALLYRKAKVLVWLSAYEGFGLPPLEALAASTPVITSNTSSLPEVVGEAALKIGNPLGATSSTGGVGVEDGPLVGSIVDAMEKILIDEALRTWFIAKGEAQVQKFSWEKTAEQTLEVFRVA